MFELGFSTAFKMIHAEYMIMWNKLTNPQPLTEGAQSNNRDIREGDNQDKTARDLPVNVA